MKTLLIVYHSMTGGTRQMAEAAADAARAARLAEKMRGVSVSASGEVRTSRAALASLR